MRVEKRVRCWRASGALAILVLCAAPEAMADDEPSSADVAAARALGQEGVKLAEAGNCQDALEKLARSEKLFHAPTTLAKLGECQIQLGKIVEGTENLNKVVREQLPPGAPAAFAQAQERAKKLLAEAKPKIAKLKIAVAAPPDAQVTVKIDGETVPSANLNTNRPTDPGEHVVEASAPGYKTATAKVRLPEGGIDSVALTLEVDPTAPKPAPTPPVGTGSAPVGAEPSPSPPPGDTTTPSESPNRLPSYIALGVGVAGLGVGTVFGLMASGKKNDLDGACNADKVCPPSSQDTLDSANTFATVSTVGFIVGAVGIVAGGYLYFSAGSGKSAASKPTATPVLGLGGAGIRGTV